VKRPAVLLLGPSREAISGVTTHVNALFASGLASSFELAHFQVGSEGRDESAPGRLWRLAASPFQLAEAIARLDARIVHINTSLNAKAYWRDLVYLLVAKLAGARVVYQVHGGTLQEFTAGRRLFARFARWAARWPDAVVVLSQAESESFRVWAGAQTVEVVPNGIDGRLYQLCARAAPEREMPLRLIYVGRLAEGKGLLETLEGLRLARSRGTAARLVLAGSGALELRLRQFAREAGLAREVSFVGPAHGEHKARLLAQADALVLASYSEGLPYALLEAMAAGVVPIVTPVGAIPEVVAHGEHGVLVQPRDPESIAAAIAGLASRRAELARMSAACRSRIAGAYSIERVARDFSQLYWGVCATRAPRTAV
jgi:glycosyltransferase involved in cell wall biosynthesis